MAKILILGAGFGGVTVATELRRLLGEDHEIVLVDSRERFMMGLRKLWAVVGIGTLEAGSRSRKRLLSRGIRFLQRRIDQIDAGNRRAATEEGTLEGDFLVVALGAEARPALVPGLAEHAHNVWSREGVAPLRSELDRLQKGRIAIVIAGVPYPCPPAPYECAMLLEGHLRERGLREQIEVTVATIQPMLLPNAGKAGSDWLAARLAERGIAFEVGRTIERFEEGRVVFTEGALEADLLIGVPPHRAPVVVKQSGLTGNGEWIAVDQGTLETDYDNVFAVGDVTGIKLANGLALPKAGVMAELEGQRVAAAIAARVLGESEPPPFDGRGFCFMETGKETAAMIQGDFFAQPEPHIELQEPSIENAEGKHRFEAERLGRWFGG